MRTKTFTLIVMLLYIFSNKEVVEYVSDADGYAWAKAFTFIH